MFFFQKKIVGLDIADRSIEVAELLIAKGGPVVVSTGRVLLKAGVVERGIIRDERLLAEALRAVFIKAKPHPIESKTVIFGLPESQVYTHIFELGAHQKKERDWLIAKEAQASIPLRNEDLLFSYRVLSEEKSRVEVLLVAASKAVVLEWDQFFKRLQLEVQTFDIETLAAFRGLFVTPPKAPVCVVDIGATTTNIAIFTSKGLRYSYCLDIGGDIMTQELAKTLNTTLQEAEKMKRELGIVDRKERIFLILIKILEPIAKEVKTALEYFRERYQEEVKEVVFIGGSSKLKGLIDYMKPNLNVLVRLGESVLLRNRAFLEYIEAVGLALRAVDEAWEKKDPAFSIAKGKADTLLTRQKIEKERGPEEMIVSKENQEIEESSLPLTTIIDEARRLRFQKNLLTTILIVGAVFISLEYGYREYQGARQQEESQRRAQLKARWEKYVNRIDFEDQLQGGLPSESQKGASSFKTPLLLINETDTGWLNVREGPGANFAIIGRTYAGKQHSLLQKEAGWYKITLEEGKEGWVSAEFVTLLEQ